MSDYGDSLREAANYFDRYVEDEVELIKLAGFNLATLIDKLKAGYTIEAPKEKDWAPHLLNCACSDDWAQGMRKVYILNVGYGWDDLTDDEKRKLYESQTRIIETCPKCGHDLVDLVIATYPPIPQKKCFNCGWEWTGEAEKVVRVPFNDKED